VSEERQLTLREAWSNIIEPADYELHMANVGQAQANAELVRELVGLGGVGQRILFAGCGPGQFLEVASTDYLVPHRCVFTDLSPAFIEQVRARAQALGLDFVALVDDVEDSKLDPGFDAIVLVLVLEHTRWQRTLAEMIRLQPKRLIVVIQRNPTEMATMVTSHRELPGSLKACAEGEKPSLLEPEVLVSFLGGQGWVERRREVRDVADGKAMIGFVFEERGEQLD
jgi:SAM-dependent methyltransferase